MAQAKAKFDLHQTITDQIIDAIEAGVKPWTNGWVGAGGSRMPLRATGEGYKGMNVLILWCVAQSKGYRSPFWMTYRQAQELGGQVRKGERSATVIKYGTFAKKDDSGAVAVNENGEEERRGYAKAYHVFNADQIDGLPERFHPTETEIDTGAREIETAQAWFDDCGIAIETRDRNPCYVPSEDRVFMPPVSAFRSAEAFYSTLAHECVHATGAAKRLNRDMSPERAKYAAEELVAEIGACFVCANIGIAPDIDDSAAYVASWLKALKNDKRFIFSAAGEAQKAADYLVEQVAYARNAREAA